MADPVLQCMTCGSTDTFEVERFVKLWVRGDGSLDSGAVLRHATVVAGRLMGLDGPGLPIRCVACNAQMTVAQCVVAAKSGQAAKEAAIELAMENQTKHAPAFENSLRPDVVEQYQRAKQTVAG